MKRNCISMNFIFELSVRQNEIQWNNFFWSDFYFCFCFVVVYAVYSLCGIADKKCSYFPGGKIVSTFWRQFVCLQECVRVCRNIFVKMIFFLCFCLPIKSHSPFVIKLLMSPPFSSFNARSSCKKLRQIHWNWARQISIGTFYNLIKHHNILMKTIWFWCKSLDFIKHLRFL